MKERLSGAGHGKLIYGHKDMSTGKVSVDMSVDVNNAYHSTGNSLYGIASGVFKIVLILLLMIMIMRVTLGSTQVVSFTSFLQYIQNAPTIDVSGLRSFTSWGDSLTSIPIIGKGLNFLVSLVSVAMYGAVGVIQVIRYAVYCLGFIFV